jgi:hypothetical protein
VAEISPGVLVGATQLYPTQPVFRGTPKAMPQ